MASSSMVNTHEPTAGAASALASVTCPWRFHQPEKRAAQQILLRIDVRGQQVVVDGQARQHINSAVEPLPPLGSYVLDHGIDGCHSEDDQSGGRDTRQDNRSAK
jgi:hypothetical protein